jgi:hypothetical protein
MDSVLLSWLANDLLQRKQHFGMLEEVARHAAGTICCATARFIHVLVVFDDAERVMAAWCAD